MKIFVINLERDMDRRLSIQSQLNKFEIPFEFEKGVLGSAIPKEELAVIYDKKKTFRNLCRELTKAEIGCAISHINVYKRIVEENIPYALILEDDIIIPKQLSMILKKIEPQIDPRKPDLFLLSRADNVKNKHEYIHPNIYPFYSENGAYSYIVTNFCAKILLKAMFPICDVADCWPKLKKNKVIDIYAMNPPLFYPNELIFALSVGQTGRNEYKKLMGNMILYKLCRAFWKPINYMTAFYNRIFNPYKGLYNDKRK